jgi:hypothetical protein
MTMPHLMNCPHSETGWCPDCVAHEATRVQDMLFRALHRVCCNAAENGTAIFDQELEEWYMQHRAQMNEDDKDDAKAHEQDVLALNGSVYNPESRTITRHQNNESERLQHTEEELVWLVAHVKHMRRLQKQYFRTRDQSVLNESKDAEKHIDHWIEEREARQRPKLF